MREPSGDLSRATVFITGASRGLGRALAEAFARAGSRLVLCARTEDRLRELAESLAPATDVEWGAADVTSASQVAALVERATARFGPITTLVNNASILGPRVPLRDHPVDEWRQVLDVNLTGTLTCSREVLPGMRAAGRGSIINVSSGVGNKPRGEWGAYAVSKWGVEALTQNMALEEKDSGVRANIVDPGRLRTDMRRAAYPDEDPSAPAPPERAVPVFLWLASSASDHVSGERFMAQEFE